MFVPIYDNNPVRHIRFQFVTVGLVIANVVIFVFFQSGLFSTNAEAFTLALGAIPATIWHAPDLAREVVYVPEEVTLFTYMFLHGDWFHLLSNMLFLWVFGDNVEDATGHIPFLIFYVLCGVAAGGAHVALSPSSETPLVGASGAIAGILAAYLMLHPRVRLWVLVLARIPLPLPAWVVLIAWIGIQVVNVLMPSTTGADGNRIAFVAHIAGFVAGAALILFMRRPGVRLFDQDLVAR